MGYLRRTLSQIIANEAVGKAEPGGLLADNTVVNPTTVADLLGDPVIPPDPQAGATPGSSRFKAGPAAGKKNPFIRDYHSALLAADTSQTINQMSTMPDFWLVVARLTAGWINVSIGSGQGPVQWRLVSGTLRLPVFGGSPSLTINTVGATGTWDAYAVQNVEDFDIEA